MGQNNPKEGEPMIPDIAHLPMNPRLLGQAEVIRDIVYSKNGQKLTLILPWAEQGSRPRLPGRPLIVFVQGSGWTTPNLDYEIPFLSHFAEEGYAVATVCHRSATDGHPFPAFLLDVKCAIRFLRAHAADYAIDPDRVAAMGSSSGGNAVCLVGLTGDDPKLKTEEYAQESDAVLGVVSCAAPTDLPALFRHLWNTPDSENRVAAMLGPDKSRWEEKERQYSPVFRVEDGKPCPPFLLLHGTADQTVPCAQMEVFYRRLKAAGADVTACYVDGAEHGGNFWGPEMRGVIHDHLCRWLQSAEKE